MESSFGILKFRGSGTSCILRKALDTDSGLMVLPSLEEARAQARAFDRLVEVQCEEAINELALVRPDLSRRERIELVKREQCSQEAIDRRENHWPLDEYRSNNYFLWAIWIIHCLAMSDDGSRYGSMLSSYKYIAQYQRRGYFPFDEATMRAFLTRVYPIRLASLRIQICPSCKLTRCQLFRRSWHRDFLSYFLSEEEQQLARDHYRGEIGPILRYRQYRSRSSCTEVYRPAEACWLCTVLDSDDISRPASSGV